MITFSDIEKLFEIGMAGEILFYVNDSEKFNYCWMGCMPDRNTGKDIYWFGLTPDGKNAYDFDSFEELSNAKVFDGESLIDIWDRVEILEVDACDAEEMIKMRLDK